MVVPLYNIRDNGVHDRDPYKMYNKTDSTLFSIKLHYGGVFTISPNMKYNSGNITFVDLIDSDQFSVHEIDFMLEDLGQDGHRVMFYHFLKPGCDLDNGLEPLACVLLGITPVAKKLVLDVNNKLTGRKDLEGPSSGKDLEGQSSGKDLEEQSSAVVKAKSDVLLNNMYEVFNEKLVAGRDRPIVATSEFAREYIMKRIVNVNKLIDRCVTPTATKILRSNSNEAMKYTVDHAGDDLYQKVYSFNIKPIRDRIHWPKCNVPTTLLPPKHQPQVRRPPNERKKSAPERDVLKIVKNGKLSREHKTVICNKCNTEGHNSRSCTRPRDPKSNKRKVPSKGMDDTDAPVGSQSKKKATTQAARSATSIDKGKAPTCSQSKDKGKAPMRSQSKDKGKAPTTTTGVPKKAAPRKKIIKLG
nr:transposase, mutator type [Tanacetum cinerariifolium]